MIHTVLCVLSKNCSRLFIYLEYNNLLNFLLSNCQPPSAKARQIYTQYKTHIKHFTPLSLIPTA